jgi:hypothetical protein
MMSGTIALSHDTRWSGAGWLFDWVLRFVAREAGDERISADLQEIMEENLGWFDLTTLPVEIRRVVTEKLGYELVDAAETTLPGTLPERQRVLELLRDLSEMARGISDPG